MKMFFEKIYDELRSLEMRGGMKLDSSRTIEYQTRIRDVIIRIQVVEDFMRSMGREIDWRY